MPTFETVPQTHTPGPWGWRVRPATEGTAAPIAYITADTGHREVAVLYRDVDPRQHQANARLVAAAPDLLAACRLALGRLTDGTEISGVVATHVRAAIAKATGGVQ